jgi:hypothetical protein
MADGNSGNDYLHRMLAETGPTEATPQPPGAPPTPPAGGMPAPGRIAAFSAQVDQLSKSAKEGGWTVSDEAGSAYISALENYVTRWAADKGKFQTLSHAPELAEARAAAEQTAPKLPKGN